MPALQTARLLLRPFTRADFDALTPIYGDPDVMRYMRTGNPAPRERVAFIIDYYIRYWQEHPFGLWCVDLDGEPIGFTGLSVPWFRDGVEVGWRLRSEHWGHGYAPEAATECLRYAFQDLALDEVISFTAPTNTKSQRVMQKIGLVRDDGGDFEHPGVPVGSPLRPHVLYRITRDGYRARL